MGYGPITLAHSGGTEPFLLALPEAATQTFKRGVPYRLSSGTIVEGDSSDPWSSADILVGFGVTAGKNLTTAGTTEEGASLGAPQNQSSAKTIAAGSPIKLGTTLFYPANGQNVFVASLLAGQVFAAALIIPGTFYALKKDATTGYWYVDNTDTSGNNACVDIVGGVDNDTSLVKFKIKPAQRYY